jgi:hypothetical protein
MFCVDRPGRREGAELAALEQLHVEPSQRERHRAARTMRALWFLRSRHTSSPGFRRSSGHWAARSVPQSPWIRVERLRDRGDWHRGNARPHCCRWPSAFNATASVVQQPQRENLAFVPTGCPMSDAQSPIRVNVFDVRTVSENTLGLTTPSFPKSASGTEAIMPVSKY